MLIVLAGFVLLGLVLGFINRAEKRDVLSIPATVPAPVPAVLAEATRPPKIFRMQASLEELRRFPALDGMARDDEAARKALPQGLEVAGQWVRPEEVLEGYAHPNGKRFFIIMQPGDRAYSIFLD